MGSENYSKQRQKQESVSNFVVVESEVIDPDCMIKSPHPKKLEVECLMEYRFDSTTFSSCEYHKEKDILCLGSSKGELLNY